MVQLIIEIATKIICFALLIFQGSLLNAYLVKINNPTWWAWFVTDAIIIIVWAICLAVVRKSFKKTAADAKRCCDDEDCEEHAQSPDEIKYSFLAWLVYAIFLCPRVLLIFLNLDKFDSEGKLGNNLLNVAVGCTPLVYLALIYGFHNAEPLSSRKLYIQSIAHTGAWDLFDSVDLLELLFEVGHGVDIPSSFVTAIAVFAGINWFLPTLGLSGLRIKTIHGRVASFYFRAISTVSVMLLVNIPHLVIRGILWSNYHLHVSVLIMKNVMCFFLGLHELLEYFGEKPPQKCDRCGDWFEHLSFVEHRTGCIQRNRIDGEVCIRHE